MLAIGGTDKINYPRTQHGFVSTVRSPMAPSVSLTDLREPNQTIRSELSLSRDGKYREKSSWHRFIIYGIHFF